MRARSYELNICLYGFIICVHPRFENSLCAFILKRDPSPMAQNDLREVICGELRVAAVS